MCAAVMCVTCVFDVWRELWTLPATGQQSQLHCVMGGMLNAQRSKPGVERLKYFYPANLHCFCILQGYTVSNVQLLKDICHWGIRYQCECPQYPFSCSFCPPELKLKPQRASNYRHPTPVVTLIFSFCQLRKKSNDNIIFMATSPLMQKCHPLPSSCFTICQVSEPPGSYQE